ncbi:hypothetical protein ACLOJK_022738, partial [Asimina triloba]
HSRRRQVGHLPCQPSSMEVRRPCEAGEDVNGGGLLTGSRLDRGAAMAESWQLTLMGTLPVVDPPHAARKDGFLKTLPSPCLPYLTARYMVLLPPSGLASPTAHSLPSGTKEKGVLPSCLAIVLTPCRLCHLPSTVVATYRRLPVCNCRIDIDGKMVAVEKDNGGEPVAVFC